MKGFGLCLMETHSICWMVDLCPSSNVSSEKSSGNFHWTQAVSMPEAKVIPLTSILNSKFVIEIQVYCSIS